MVEIPELTQDTKEFMNWQWARIEPYYKQLASRELTSANISDWLSDWSRLNEMMAESERRLYIATTINTADKEAETRYQNFLNTIFPPSKQAEQALKEKLLSSRLVPPGYEIWIRHMKVEAEIYQKENLPLLAQEHKLETEYNRICGTQSIEWDGRQLTIPQLAPIFQNPDRTLREKAWKLMYSRQLADRPVLSELWRKYLNLRLQIAKNAGFDDYRSYRWKQQMRFDYTPEDCKRFHSAIENIVVPVASKIYEEGRKRLGVESLRPWDLLMYVGSAEGCGLVVDPGHEPLRPFKDESELKTRCASIFNRVDARLGEYFRTMVNEELLDLSSRPNKAPGAYSKRLPATKRSFIFMNAVGTPDDVETLLHESGHTFHNFERNKMPYLQSLVEMEFSEVASTAMELLAAPYLSVEQGGFYANVDAARVQRNVLELFLLSLPYTAVVDAFQHWVYENPSVAIDPKACDEAWKRLWERFMIGIDWNGLDDRIETGWQRVYHIFVEPFYFIEYGLSLLGAVQIWSNALQNQAEAVANYRRALALGGTVTVPALYSAAGAKFDMSADTLKPCVELMEKTIEELDAQSYE